MKKKRLFLIPLCLLLLAAGWLLLRSRIPQRWYTADELGTFAQGQYLYSAQTRLSKSDFRNNGIHIPLLGRIKGYLTGKCRKE